VFVFERRRRRRRRRRLRRRRALEFVFESELPAADAVRSAGVILLNLMAFLLS